MVAMSQKWSGRELAATGPRAYPPPPAAADYLTRPPARTIAEASASTAALQIWKEHQPHHSPCPPAFPPTYNSPRCPRCPSLHCRFGRSTNPTTPCSPLPWRRQASKWRCAPEQQPGLSDWPAVASTTNRQGRAVYLAFYHLHLHKVPRIQPCQRTACWQVHSHDHRAELPKCTWLL